MKNYILVHGAWGGAWEFSKVIELLSADRSKVIAVDLPGHGDNQVPIAEVTMNAYVQKVSDIINDLGEKVILVGHSLAGSIISQVAENIPDKIDRLIYVAASLPKSGDTVMSLMQSDKKSELLPNIILSEDQSYATLKNEDIANLLLHDVVDRDYVEKLIPKFSIKQATEPFMASVKLSEKKFGSVTKYYIRATLDKVMSPSLQDEMINNWKVEQVFTLESGHFPLTSIPDRLVEVIKKAS